MQTWFILVLPQRVNFLVNVAFCCEIKYQDNFPEVWGSDEGSCDKSVFSSLAGNIWFSDSPRPERWRMCFESEQRNSIVQQCYKNTYHGGLDIQSIWRLGTPVRVRSPILWFAFEGFRDSNLWVMVCLLITERFLSLCSVWKGAVASVIWHLGSDGVLNFVFNIV